MNPTEGNKSFLSWFSTSTPPKNDRPIHSSTLYDEINELIKNNDDMIERSNKILERCIGNPQKFADQYKK